MLNLKTFLVWIPAKRIVVKTPFIKLRKKALFKGKTTILKELLPREGVKIGLATKSGSDLRNTAPEKLILSPKSQNASYKKEFINFKFTKKLAKLIPKSPKKQHKSLSTTLNWLWPEQISPFKPAKCYLAGEGGKESSTISAQELSSLINSFSLSAIKKHNYVVKKRKFARKKATRSGEPQSLAEALKSPFLRQWLKAIKAKLTQLLEYRTFKFLLKN